MRQVQMQYYRMHGRGLKTNPRRSLCFSLVQVRSFLIRAIAGLQSGRHCEALSGSAVRQRGRLRQCCVHSSDQFVLALPNVLYLVDMNLQQLAVPTPRRTGQFRKRCWKDRSGMCSGSPGPRRADGCRFVQLHHVQLEHHYRISCKP